MLRSKLKLFEKGDRLICIHDTIDLHTGDVVDVHDICDDCLGMLLEGHAIHYQDRDFEKYSTEKFQHIDNDLLNKQKVVNVFSDILKLIALNQHRGAIYSEPVIDALKHNMILLGIDKDIMIPTNKTPEV